MYGYIRNLIAVALVGAAATVAAADTGAMIDEAMHGAHRSEDYKARDQYRHPPPRAGW